MTLNRAINGVDHVQRAARCSPVRDVPGSDVKRKEFGGQSTLLHRRDAGAIGHWRRATEIVVIVGHRRRHIIVRIDDDCFAMNLKSLFPELLIARFGGDGQFCGAAVACRPVTSILIRRPDACCKRIQN